MCVVTIVVVNPALDADALFVFGSEPSGGDELVAKPESTGWCGCGVFGVGVFAGGGSGGVWGVVGAQRVGVGLVGWFLVWGWVRWG